MRIELVNIAKKYENRENYTLENINLTIENNEFFVILGPSGCGKTTLLRMIAGLNSITKGDLIFDGVRVNGLAPKDRDIAMVFQSYALFPHLTNYQNIAFGLKVRGERRDVVDRRVKDVAHILKIDEHLNSKPADISGGQRQRVALGRAIARKPKLFLMDEPLSNLDAKLRENMRTELVKIHTLLDSTTIYVTHDQLEAMTMATRIIVMNNSKIQQLGTPRQLYNEPANVFVAKFIGSPTMNVFSGSVVGKTFVNDDNNVKIPLSEEHLAQIAKSGAKKVVAGIRSENVKVAKTAKDKVANGLAVTCELLGKEQQVEFAVSDTLSVVGTFPADLTISLTEPTDLSFDEKRIHLFDQTTGNRIN